MDGMQEIERLTRAYAEARIALSEKMEAVKAEMQAVKKRYARGLRQLADRALSARAELAAEVDAQRALFEKPRTRVLHGLKVGFAKNPGRLEMDDEAKTIQLIRRHLNAEAAGLLIRVSEKVNRAALNDLDAQDLKRIGVRVAGGGDERVIRAVDGEIEKLVDALLEGADEEAEHG